jgi:hypothetical protein
MLQNKRLLILYSANGCSLPPLALSLPPLARHGEWAAAAKPRLMFFGLKIKKNVRMLLLLRVFF